MNGNDRQTDNIQFRPPVNGNEQVWLLVGLFIHVHQDQKTISVFKRNLCETESAKGNGNVW